MRYGLALLAATICIFINTTRADEPINPYPRAILDEPILASWEFNELKGWREAHDTSVRSEGGNMVITSTGTDPYIYSPGLPERISGPLLVRFRAKCDAGSTGQIFWVTADDPHWSEKNSSFFKLINDGEWHDYEIGLDSVGHVRHLRFDPGSKEGTVEVDSMSIHRRILHPLEITQVKTEEEATSVFIRNHSANELTCDISVNDGDVKQVTIAPETKQVVAMPNVGTDRFERLAIRVTSDDLPEIERVVFGYFPKRELPGAVVIGDEKKVALRVAADGAGAEIIRDETVVAIMNPIACDPETLDTWAWRVAPSRSLPVVILYNDHRLCKVNLGITPESLCAFMTDSDDPLRGPVVRVLGTLEQGLLAGVEYLGHVEHSSSKADIEGPERLRFRPDTVDVTMPLMAYSSDKATITMTWRDMTLQPTFATPNFFDGTPDHLMAIEGKRMGGLLRIDKAFESTEDRLIEKAILWTMKPLERDPLNLPPLPTAPRTRDEQAALCLKGLQGPIATEDGWRHAYVPGQDERFPAEFHADQASTIWRITGEMPDVPKLVHGGAHLEDSASYFISGRAGDWLAFINRRAEGIRRSQGEDGSFRYNGEFKRGHFENTSSGHCGQRAFALLQHAQMTGNKDSLAAGVKTLEYMKRFRTPRGAQLWEISLHTPDIMASAWCCHAYLLGYELTGEEHYLKLARRWAITGIPFVYQWQAEGSDIMPYATISVLGATNYRKPVWIGLPVQWCGLRYANSLVEMSKYDDTVPWLHIAEGILICGQQMQYPDGEMVGCLPDVFRLEEQTRHPADINPSAMYTLEKKVRGECVGLQTAINEDGTHRVIAPFPVMFENANTVRINGQEGLQYQIVIDGRRIETIDSEGTDRIAVD